MKTFTLFWSPEGRPIATVTATTARAAIRKAPRPYRKYLGEIYAQQTTTSATRRKLIANFAREMRSVKTPALTMKERNQAIRSHVRSFARRTDIKE